jgi:hypothetical protein
MALGFTAHLGGMAKILRDTPLSGALCEILVCFRQFSLVEAIKNCQARTAWICMKNGTLCFKASFLPKPNRRSD